MTSETSELRPALRSDPEKREPGGQIGNVNSVRHGQRAKRHGMVHSRLGKRFDSAYRDCCTLRRAVESRVRERHGEVTPWQAGRIQTLLRLEESCRALELEIRTRGSDMTSTELRATRESIVRWSLQRDNLLLELLGDDAKAGSGSTGTADPFAIVQQKAAEWRSGASGEAESQDHASDRENASEGHTENESG